MRAALQLVAALRRGVRALGSGATRDPRFAHLDQADVTALRALCPATDDAEALEQHNVDWMRKYRGRAALALRPRSAREAAAALEYCSKRRLAVVPQGGNTGLVGGSVPLFDEIVLSTRAMDKVESVDPDTGVAVAGAGCILQHLDEAMSAKGWMAPLDLGAKGTCVIGGNVSTNAGGLRLLRYGSLRGSVLGLEVALADGSVLDLMSENRKDATGYDLKQLFIGAEGTLGVVTSVAIQGAPRPSAVNVAWLAVPGYGEVLAALRLARRRLGEVLSAFELVDAASLRLALGNLPHNRDPLPECTSPFYVLVETSGSNDAHDAEKLESFLEEALGEGVVRDGVVAASERESAALWELREGISDALTARGGVHKYDVSVPLKELYKMVDECRDVVLVPPRAVGAPRATRRIHQTLNPNF